MAQWAVHHECVTRLSSCFPPTTALFGLNWFVDLLLHKQLPPELVTYRDNGFSSHCFHGSGIWGSRGPAVLAQGPLRGCLI